MSAESSGVVIAHSDEQGAAATWKKTYGFHPMIAVADHGGDGAGEALAMFTYATAET
ncbi:hypothetical protein [Streptosporangium sp. CA-115845]|uniref:hypothetical protein n=1 Tax=Streptosporangium sp. CA-115845 TaxID=3240071 RepID=UPI003D90EDD0